jgi:hypothetical protein
MRIIHVLPTDKPSRLKQNKITKKISLVNKGIDLTSYTPINIYITSDEEIKDGDWFFRNNKIHQLRWDDGNGNLYTKNGLKIYKSSSKKIILTTDTDLITDGVQSIDDEFLQWYIQNPSCEWVDIKKIYLTNKGEWKDVLLPSEWEVDTKINYKITIPKEEPKQETLEDHVYIFDGAKWKQERMYSEEEVILLIAEAICKFKLGKLHDEEQIIESLLQFKKK